MKYHYVEPDNPNTLKQADTLEDLVLLLYSGKAQLPREEQTKTIDIDYVFLLKKEISKFDKRLPLYDIRSNHIFLVFRENVYPSIFYEDYRFIDGKFYKDLLKLENPDEYDLENIRILSIYDFKQLEKTYLRVFYESFVVTTYITKCKKPSFYPGMNHMSPYYNIDEINYLAYDWGLTDHITIDRDKLDILCEKISQYDISANTLIDHQMYIYDSKAIGLVKHYSLYGSYYINQYLRITKCCLANPTECSIARNPYLEKQASIMINLIGHAPEFKEEHTVYRFIETDDHISNLSIGDIYIDNSFTSTTRNPFYCKENYKFGYILVKIKLPKNIPGVGICIEAYSNFPKEEEIVLMPATQYRVDNIIDTTTQGLSILEDREFHKKFNIDVTKKYEFTWIGNRYLENNKNNDNVLVFCDDNIPDIATVDFRDLIHNNPEIFSMTSISSRINYFQQNYTNINNQFVSTIGKTRYTFVIESYDSSGVYSPFFFYEISNGIMLTTSNPKRGNINIMIEIGEELHVNYYFRYSVTDTSNVVNLNRIEWIEWLAMLAYIMGCRNVIIHSNYSLLYDKNDSIYLKIKKTKHTFPADIYQYMKYHKKMYNYTNITPQFDYANIDKLKYQLISDTIFPSDKNELFRIANESGKENMYDLYIYIIENHPELIDAVTDVLDRVYDTHQNPFKNIYYKLDSWTFLLQQNIISSIPTKQLESIRKGSFKKIIGDDKIKKFKNRLRNLIRDVDISARNTG